MARTPCGVDTLASGSITGTVHSGTSGLPVPGAEIELMDGAARHGGGAAALLCTVWSDSSGRYVAGHIAAGTVTMQVAHPGFDTLTVQVVAAPQGIVRLDVSLAPGLVVLDSVRVPGRVPGIAPVRSPAAAIDHGAQGPGDWRWQGSPADAAGATGDPECVSGVRW